MPTAESNLPCIECLREFMAAPPLEILARVLLHLGSKAEQKAARIMTAYDAFIGILADPDKRRELGELTPDQTDSSPVFKEARQRSREFGDGLLELFFDMDELKFLTRNYGVF